jgi:hypothetical protein
MYTDSEIRIKGRTVGTLRFNTNHEGHTTIDHQALHRAFIEAKRIIEQTLTTKHT